MRAHWDTLPAAVRSAVEHRTGPILKADPVDEGTANHLTAVLHPAGGPAVFCKGVHGVGPRLRMLRVEAAIGPHLGALAPTVLWRAAADGWTVVGFEHVPGRGADLTPGSPDLPLVADTLTRMQRLAPCPPVPTLPLGERWARMPAWRMLADQRADVGPWAAGRLDELVAWEGQAPHAVDGDVLAHCDLAWNNLIIHGRSVRVVDWALAGRAAPWVDTAYVVLRLIQYGHAPAVAEQWAAGVPGWADAEVGAVDAFAVAVAGIRAWRAASDGAPPYMAGLAEVALRWVRHRVESRVRMPVRVAG